MLGGRTSDDRATWLHTESRHWVDEGLITPAQLEEILSHYPIGGSERGGLVVARRLLIGGAAIGLLAIGLMLIVAANWDVLSFWQRPLLWQPARSRRRCGSRYRG